MFRRKWITFAGRFPAESDLLTIVGDSAIATVGVGEGRLLPLLIIDTSRRPDIDEYLKLHSIAPPGDVVVRWGERSALRDEMVLWLEAKRPLELNALIKFELPKNHGILVKQILATKGLYLRSGVAGDRMITTQDRPTIFVEVPDTGFRKHFEKMYRDYAYRKFRNEGLNRSAAKQAVREAWVYLSQLAAFRIPSGPVDPQTKCPEASLRTQSICH